MVVLALVLVVAVAAAAVVAVWLVIVSFVCKVLRSIKLVTMKSIKFAKKHYEVMKKMLDKTKPAENKIIKDVYQSAQSILK